MGNSLEKFGPAGSKNAFAKMLSTLIRYTFGCWHLHISRPFTLSGSTYEVCLDCGRQFPYSLQFMCRVKEPTLGADESQPQTALNSPIF